MSVGAVEHRDVMRSIELFATEVAPLVRTEVARRAALVRTKMARREAGAGAPGGQIA
jgi:hypothetical protein